MKNINKLYTLLMGSFLLTSCSDFEEINKDPGAANGDQIRVEYALNDAITQAQQDPGIAERAFVLNWKTASRQQWEAGYGNAISVGQHNDDWIGGYYSASSAWQKAANLAIALANEKIDKGIALPYDQQMIPNIKEVARIWRVYLMSEFVDNFGTMPINAFQGKNPEFASTKDVYYFLLDELKDAASKIDISVVPQEDDKKYDRAYGFNFSKWVKYANSMRMRLAMRLSEVDPTKAQAEFEDAVKGDRILTTDDNFKVKEGKGWDALAGVMSREWNEQLLSATLNNLMINLGGVKTADQLTEARYQSHIKNANYMGQRYEKHFSLLTNDPSQGFWFDGLYNMMDPRAYKLFFIPGDFDNTDYCKYPSWTEDYKTQKKDLLQDDKKTKLETIDASFTWNAPAIGEYGDKGAKNQVYAYSGTCPGLVLKYRDGSNNRIFFASWETYFLIAEAGLRGWVVPMGAKDAYEQGVRENFSYNGVEKFAGQYLSSKEYNRVGTSVAWDHTAEPPATVTMQMIDGYTKTPGTYTFKYPVTSKTLYGKALNDKLVKIITQKFIANMPYLPLESWNDQRRTGLPFWEIPCVELPIVTMPQLNSSNYTKAQVNFFPQRLKFPASLNNNNPEGYIQAVEKLGGKDDVFTPLWWAKH